MVRKKLNPDLSEINRQLAHGEITRQEARQRRKETFEDILEQRSGGNVFRLSDRGALIFGVMVFLSLALLSVLLLK